MNLLPYEKFSIQTDLTHDEVLKRLGGAIEPAKILKWGFYDKSYHGTLTQERFSVKRSVFWAQDTFFPQISGRIHRDKGQSIVGIAIVPPGALIFFETAWLFIAVVMGIILMNNAPSIDRITALPFPILLVFLQPVVAFVTFKVDCANSANFFRKLLADNP